MPHPFATEEIAARVRKLPSSFQFFRWITRSEHLHFGLFETPDESFGVAQDRMTECLLSWFPDRKLRILDVGCGIGGTACTLAGQGHYVAGLAPDPHLIEYAEAAAVAADVVANTEFHPIGFHDVPVAQTKPFDLVLTQESMHYIHPAGDTLQGFFDLLKPGGRLVLGDIVCRDEALRTIAPYHPAEDFERTALAAGFVTAHREDLTQRAIPTIRVSLDILRREEKEILAFFSPAQPDAEKDFARLMDHGGLERDAFEDGRLGYELFVYDKPAG